MKNEQLINEVWKNKTSSIAGIEESNSKRNELHIIYGGKAIIKQHFGMEDLPGGRGIDNEGNPISLEKESPDITRNGGIYF